MIPSINDIYWYEKTIDFSRSEQLLQGYTHRDMIAE